jgi:hypothetical protein
MDLIRLDGHTYRADKELFACIRISLFDEVGWMLGMTLPSTGCKIGTCCVLTCVSGII